MKKYICVLFVLSCMLVQPARAGSEFFGAALSNIISRPEVKAAWDESENGYSVSLPANTDFVVYGGFGGSEGLAAPGLGGDEYGAVILIANAVVEHGAQICPYQLQCTNKNKKHNSGNAYYRPVGFDAAKHCVWLCADGYSGTNCASKGHVQCDDTEYTKKWTGLSMRRGSSSEAINHTGEVQDEVAGWRQLWHVHGKGEEANDVVGVVEILQHGVLASNIRLACHSENGKGNRSWIAEIRSHVNSRLLCAPGYIPNAQNSDCVPMDAAYCDLATMTMCNGNFQLSAFNSEIHKIDTARDCARFFCVDDTKAFPRAGDTSCEPCGPDSVRAGPHPDTGVCTICSTPGQYFDRDEGTCKTAASYAKNDLQYGKGKTLNSGLPLTKQCWSLSNVDDYSKCVRGEPFGN